MYKIYSIIENALKPKNIFHIAIGIVWTIGGFCIGGIPLAIIGGLAYTAGTLYNKYKEETKEE